MKLYSARWVIAENGAVEDGALLVNDRGVIEQISSSRHFDRLDVQRVDLSDCIIAPGLVNVHAHPELAAFRGLLDDLPFHQWIPTLMRCKRGAQLSFEDYEACAQWTCVELLRAGVTTVGATEDSGAAVTALKTAGMRGVVYLETFGPAAQQVEQSMHELRAKVERCAVHANDNVKIGVSPHAPYRVSDALYAAVAHYARQEKLLVATHAAEAEAEELLVREGTGPFAAGLRTRGIDTQPRGESTVALLRRTGLLDCAPLLIHALRTSDDDIAAIAGSGASVAHCPIANARLGHGIASIVEMKERGVKVAIGTDSVASNNRLDILEDARVAQIAQRARLRSASALPATDLLEMSTRAGADILGFDTGVLAPGKPADFCAVRIDTPHATPTPEPLNTLFHSARGSDVVLTVVQGNALFENGRVTTLDEDDLRRRVLRIGGRLLAARDAS
jgi:5-methylthioadenosine/S-adenosylhomocysteine deaminase